MHSETGARSSEVGHVRRVRLRQHEKAIRRCVSALESEPKGRMAYRRSADEAFVDVAVRTVLAYLGDGEGVSQIRRPSR